MTDSKEPKAPASDRGTRCPHCLQVYLIEVAVTCVICESPLCPICFVETKTVAGEIHCPRCHAEQNIAGSPESHRRARPNSDDE